MGSLPSGNGGEPAGPYENPREPRGGNPEGTVRKREGTVREPSGNRQGTVRETGGTPPEKEGDPPPDRLPLWRGFALLKQNGGLNAPQRGVRRRSTVHVAATLRLVAFRWVSRVMPESALCESGVAGCPQAVPTSVGASALKPVTFLPLVVPTTWLTPSARTRCSAAAGSRRLLSSPRRATL